MTPLGAQKDGSEVAAGLVVSFEPRPRDRPPEGALEGALGMTARIGAVVQILAERGAAGRRRDGKLQAIRVLAVSAAGSGLSAV